jgi:hypothetical protein
MIASAITPAIVVSVSKFISQQYKNIKKVETRSDFATTKQQLSYRFFNTEMCTSSLIKRETEHRFLIMDGNQEFNQPFDYDKMYKVGTLIDENNQTISVNGVNFTYRYNTQAGGAGDDWGPGTIYNYSEIR